MSLITDIFYSSGRCEVLDTPENDADGGKGYYAALARLNELTTEIRNKAKLDPSSTHYVPPPKGKHVYAKQ
jgi:hypothetical protein